jgi:hypothetical protein
LEQAVAEEAPLKEEWQIVAAETAQTIPDQIQKPTVRPTMRWVFQCFEGIELLHVHMATSSLRLALRPIHLT